MFLLFRYVQLFVLLYVAFVSTMSLYFVLDRRLRSTRAQRWSWAAALGTMLLWAWSGHWALNNLVGISIVLCLTCFLRLQSLRVAVLCLCALLVYDVFWVFASEHLFAGQNVMVHAARLVGLPSFLAPIASLQLPMKLLFPLRWGVDVLLGSGSPVFARMQAEQLDAGAIPFAALGLGDIALPAVFLAFLHGLDASRRARGAKGGTAMVQPARADVGGEGGVGMERDIEMGRTPADGGERGGAADAALRRRAADSPANERAVDGEDGANADDEDGAGQQGARLVPDTWRGVMTVLWGGAWQRPVPYLTLGAWGYAAGLLCTLLAVFAFRVAQPALLYLVPSTVLPPLVAALRRGDFARMWGGGGEQRGL